MPQFQLRAGSDVMHPEAARDYAATWAGPGCYALYNFDSDFRVESEESRADLLEEMQRNRARVEAQPELFEPDELQQLDSFVRALKAAPVIGDESAKPPAGADAFATLDEFTQGYVEAMFFTDSAPSMDSEEWRECEAAGEEIPEGSFPSDMGVNDLAPESLADIVADCAAFQESAAELLTQAYAREYDAAQAGRDFWFTRNGHGVGFWDRKELRTHARDACEALTQTMAATHKSDPDAWAAALAKRQALEAESLGERLSTLARARGNVDSYWGDDSKVYHG